MNMPTKQSKKYTSKGKHVGYDSCSWKATKLTCDVWYTLVCIILNLQEEKLLPKGPQPGLPVLWTAQKPRSKHIVCVALRYTQASSLLDPGISEAQI